MAREQMAIDFYYFILTYLPHGRGDFYVAIRRRSARSISHWLVRQP